jgi:ADP-heptose:LPS heptosyltransferase
MNLKDHLEKIRPKKRLVNWHNEGIHEVQEYLEMIGATWKDFDGYLLEPDDGPILDMPSLRIALANCSSTNQALKKSWDKFPELSRVLTDLGYEVILLGLGDELDGCIGHDLRNTLTIKQACKALSQVDLLIAVSTGLTVVADAVKTPVLLLEGPMPTFKAHPLLSKFQIVRKYISCAPCWQKSLWYMCNDPTCMSSIQVGDVIQGMFKFLPKMKRDTYYRITPCERYYVGS